jgi:phosphate/sulfate permease
MRKLLLATAAVFAFSNGANAQNITGIVDAIYYELAPAAIGFHLITPAPQCGDVILWYGSWDWSNPDQQTPYIVRSLEQSLDFHKNIRFALKSSWGGCPYADDSTSNIFGVGTWSTQ